jgi:hypothetical protein
MIGIQMRKDEILDVVRLYTQSGQLVHNKLVFRNLYKAVLGILQLTERAWPVTGVNEHVLQIVCLDQVTRDRLSASHPA